MYRNATFALAVLLALIVGVLIGGSLPRAEAQHATAAGTYQLAASGDQVYMLDSGTGELWRLGGQYPDADWTWKPFRATKPPS